MIKNWIITGDTHRDFSRFRSYPNEWDNSETAVIILGDVGLNYNLDKSDWFIKRAVSYYKFYIYCVRGNHEARPQDVEGMQKIWDNNVNGYVYYEPNFPKIRYFLDYGVYYFNNMCVLVIGGAYSVDKYYRLARRMGWFENEELTEEEMDDCMRLLIRQRFDLVLTHTCPFAWEPKDLFLDFVDQSTVSKRMEKFLDEVRQEINSDAIWLWGHYHSDRIEVPRGEMYYKDSEELNTVVERWKKFNDTKELDWWLNKGPQFYMWVE